MPWRGPEYAGEFPTLGYAVAGWIQSYCVVPDRDQRGTPFLLTEEQLRFLLYLYALTVEGKWVYPRGAQLVRPQKSGKGPLAASICCAEAAGPVRFAGWDARGEPLGRSWATPHIQVTACSEDQTSNTWRALQPMIELGPLTDWIPDSGLTRINLPGGGMIEPVTASARSRLGQRITCAIQDETHAWMSSNNGHWLADNQRRNLSGMGGRFVETTNAFDPVEQSVAERTQREPGVYVDDVDGGAGSVRNKVERRRVLRKVYGDSCITKGGWVDLDRIDSEIEALLAHDPAQAERFFLNRKLPQGGAAFDPEAWHKLARPSTPEPMAVVVLGIDGARHDDALAVVATEIKTGYQWPVCILERPEHAPEDYEHDLAQADGAVTEIFERYVVWRAYCDDQYVGHWIDQLANRYGSKRIVIWHTNRQRQVAWAVRNYADAVSSGDVSHDGNPTMAAHILNSRKRMLTVLDDHQRQMWTLSKDAIGSRRKIDAAMAAVLSWEARSDAIAAGVSLADLAKPGPPSKPDVYRADHAPSLARSFAGVGAGPMGDMS